MDRIRFYLALISAKMVSMILKMVSKSSGTSLPGLISLKIYPDFIKQTKKYVKEKIITVTGTNGKTTTSGLLSHILEVSNKKVVHNEEGANMLSGIATSLVHKTGFKRKSDYFVLESDEAYLTKLYDSLDADYLLVTNLFRDQLDRYGELDATFKKIQDAIDKNQNLALFLNADDPIVSMLGRKQNRIYYGFEDIQFMFDTIDAKAPAENVACTVCGKNLEYNKRYYAHLGDYICDCGYKRINIKYNAVAKIYLDYSEITVKYNNKEVVFKIKLPGLYNVYNSLAAIAMALELGFAPEMIQSGLDTYKSVFGRSQTLVIKGKNVLVQLIKNPVGASEALRLTANNNKSKLLIMLNDNYADGRDVSWIWDANFESLKDYNQKIIVSGDRASDMAVRLKYAGVNTDLITVENKLKKALKSAIFMTKQDETLLILPTYTALLRMQNILKKRFNLG